MKKLRNKKKWLIDIEILGYRQIFKAKIQIFIINGEILKLKQVFNVKIVKKSNKKQLMKRKTQ